MDESRIKDNINTSTYIASEFVLYPLTTVLTRVQGVYINRSVIQQKLSIFYGIGHIPFLIPGFLIRLKLGSTLDPYLRSQYNLSPVTTFAIVSSISDFINVLIKCPTEHYKHQLQSGNYTSARKFLGEYYFSGGLSLFWKGLSVFFLRDSFFNVLRFWMLDEMRKKYKRNLQRKNSYEEDFNRMTPLGQRKMMMENFKIYTWSNIFATIPAAFLTTPLDVIKTRVMTLPVYKNEGVFEIFRRILKEEGTYVLFRGAGLRSFYICSMISISTSMSFYLGLNLDDAKRVRNIMKNNPDIYD